LQKYTLLAYSISLGLEYPGNPWSHGYRNSSNLVRF